MILIIIKIKKLRKNKVKHLHQFIFNNLHSKIYKIFY